MQSTALLLSIAVAFAVAGWVPPSFCGGIACPQYAVLNSSTDWELRAYQPSTWITTSNNGTDLTGTMSKSFMSNFKYIQSNNIAMTSPVLTLIEPGQGPACTSRFNTSFFLAGAAPFPQPQLPGQTVTTLPGFKVLVKWFGGYWSDSIIQNQFVLLNALAVQNNIPLSGLTAVAGYDSPFHFWNRHNEVWAFL